MKSILSTYFLNSISIHQLDKPEPIMFVQVWPPIELERRWGLTHALLNKCCKIDCRLTPCHYFNPSPNCLVCKHLSDQAITIRRVWLTLQAIIPDDHKMIIIEILLFRSSQLFISPLYTASPLTQLLNKCRNESKSYPGTAATGTLYRSETVCMWKNVQSKTGQSKIMTRGNEPITGITAVVLIG